MFDGKSVLITGGTGSFGHKYTETLLSRYKPKKVIIYSRDELKQYEMWVKATNARNNGRSLQGYECSCPLSCNDFNDFLVDGAYIERRFKSNEENPSKDYLRNSSLKWPILLGEDHISRLHFEVKP